MASCSTKTMDEGSLSLMGQRLRPLWRFAKFATLALLLWSAFIESSFFYAGFLGMLGNTIIATALTVLLALLLESCKFYLGAYTFRFIVRGWLREGWGYLLAFLIVLPLCTATFFGSGFLSIKGAHNVAYFFSSQTQGNDLVSADSINTYFDHRQESLMAEKENALGIKRHGRPTYQATVLLTQLQEQSNLIEAQRQTSLAHAQEKNSHLQSLSNKSAQDWGTWLSRFGGFGEGLTLFFLLFIEVYEKARQVSSPKQATKKKPANTSPRQKKLHVEAANQTQELVVTRVLHENKSYPPSRFKDWLDKVEHRSRGSTTASARLRNSQRHAEMLVSWNNYMDRVPTQ